MHKSSTLQIKNEQKIIDCILEPAQDAAKLFGLVKEKNNFIILESANLPHLNLNYTVHISLLPNDFAWLAIVCVNDEPAGSIVAIKISNSIYHMVGMFIKENFRGKNIKRLLIESSSGEILTKTPTPAEFLLQAAINFLCRRSWKMTLEVMNFNAPAYSLYDKAFEAEALQKSIGFELLSKFEIENYAKLRGKKIGTWHQIEHTAKQKAFGVQWAHVPNYNSQSTWSISRIYALQLPNEKKIFSQQKNCARDIVANRYEALLTVIRYGQPFSYLGSKIQKIVKPKKQTF